METKKILTIISILVFITLLLSFFPELHNNIFIAFVCLLLIEIAYSIKVNHNSFKLKDIMLILLRLVLLFAALVLFKFKYTFNV